jgi:hypothetical protein
LKEVSDVSEEQQHEAGSSACYMPHTDFLFGFFFFFFTED